LEKSLQRAYLWKVHILLLSKISSLLEKSSEKFGFSEAVVSNLCEVYLSILMPRLVKAGIGVENLGFMRKLVSQARELNRLGSHSRKYGQAIEVLEERLSEIKKLTKK
jgi:hypothetical protein